MEKKKLVIAFVCHVSNPKIREHLRLSKNRLWNFLTSLRGHQAVQYNDYAPWNTFIFNEIVNYADIEAHAISPHPGMLEDVEEYEENHVTYHFFKNKPSRYYSLLHSKFFPKRKIEYRRNRKIVNHFLKKIHPDLVVLVGAETPDYCSTVLDVEDIPIYVLSQAVYNNPDFKKFYNPIDYQIRAELEMKLFNKSGYVGVYSEKHRDALKALPYRGYIFHFGWPSTLAACKMPEVEKQYDFVNFAHYMSEAKGYHDSVKALAIVKKQFPSVRLALIDHGPTSVREELMGLIEQYNLKENVSFVPFFESIDELFEFLNTVRFGVLPCKLDNISGTMLNCMVTGLPMVVYRTEGTPMFNEKRDTVLIAEMNNVEELANHMTRLMFDKQLGEDLRHNGYLFIEDYAAGGRQNMKNLVDNFMAIVDNYRYGTPIPDYMLY